MAEIASWNGHKFVVSPKLIESFRDLSIKGSCETTDKTENNQKYVERKAGEASQVTLTLDLNAMTGVKDVYTEAQQFIRDATDGKTDYFYLGSGKIVPAKMMLTSAEITTVVTMPGKGNVWISCEVKLTFKQASPTEGGTNPAGPTGNSGKYVARVYYSTGSGVIDYVLATSDISYADALKKAYKKVPRNAMWAGTTKPQASNPGPDPQGAGNNGRLGSENKKPPIGLDARVQELDRGDITIT